LQSDIIRCDENGEWDFSPYKCSPVCGKIEASTTFITAGETVDIHDVPWQTAIYIKNSSNLFVHICGGTIISTRFVLSGNMPWTFLSMRFYNVFFFFI